jgi:hypothetical protein
MPSLPTVAELRRAAEAEGISPSDADLRAALAFLEVLAPRFEELERWVEEEPA